jgi:hypothetical protein
MEADTAGAAEETPSGAHPTTPTAAMIIVTNVMSRDQFIEAFEDRRENV